MVHEDIMINKIFWERNDLFECGFSELCLGLKKISAIQEVKANIELPLRHDKLAISFILIMLDDWDNQILTLKLDDNATKEFTSNPANNFINYGGQNDFYDSFVEVSFEIYHSKESLNLTFYTSNKYQLERGFGIINFTVEAKAYCQDGARINPSNSVHSCICKPGYYPKKINCDRKYNESFCFECRKCNLSCELCYPKVVENETYGICYRCQDDYALINGTCFKNESKKLLLIYFKIKFLI